MACTIDCHANALLAMMQMLTLGANLCNQQSASSAAGMHCEVKGVRHCSHSNWRLGTTCMSCARLQVRLKLLIASYVSLQNLAEANFALKAMF